MFEANIRADSKNRMRESRSVILGSRALVVEAGSKGEKAGAVCPSSRLRQKNREPARRSSVRMYILADPGFCRESTSWVLWIAHLFYFFASQDVPARLHLTGRQPPRDAAESCRRSRGPPLRRAYRYLYSSGSPSLSLFSWVPELLLHPVSWIMSGEPGSHSAFASTRRSRRRGRT